MFHSAHIDDLAFELLLHHPCHCVVDKLEGEHSCRVSVFDMIHSAHLESLTLKVLLRDRHCVVDKLEKRQLRDSFELSGSHVRDWRRGQLRRRRAMQTEERSFVQSPD